MGTLWVQKYGQWRRITSGKDLYPNRVRNGSKFREEFPGKSSRLRVYRIDFIEGSEIK